MAAKKKSKPKNRSQNDSLGSQDDSLDSLPFEGLLVKISADMGGYVGGKMFLFPESALRNFEFTPQNQGSFDAQLQNKLINVDFAVYSPSFVLRGSAG